MRSSSATLAALSSVGIGLSAAYSWRLRATFSALALTLVLTRPCLPVAPMARTVRTASISEAKEMSSE